jgi:hypothetical protein
LHSSVNNHDNSTSILSLKEIVGIVIIFSLVLYLLFPKDNIDEIIEGEGENTNLSINYLESMLLYYPDSVKLKRILIKNYDHAGERKKALTLIQSLILEVKEKKLLGELYRTEYLLNKDIYFKTRDKTLLPEIKEKLYDYFGYEYNNNEKLDYMFFLAESTQMDFPDLKYIALNGLIKQRPELVDYALEKEVFILALVLKDKENAYKYLLKLLEYNELEKEIKVYAIGSLLKHNEYEKAKELSIWLFLHSKEREEIKKYFNIALYTTDGDINTTRELLSLYKNSRKLNTSDIETILNSLLQIGDTKGASIFATSFFKSNRELFDEIATDTVLKSLIYNEELATALEVSNYAYSKFNSTKWLDKSIQLSTWLGKMDNVVELNIEGFRRSADKRYEKYLLEFTTLDSAYSILGDIYKSKLERGDDSMVEKVAEYYEYIGAIPEAEKYFGELLRKNKKQSIHKQAISFSYKNSHFKKGLKLYDSYKKRYGIDKLLQQESITKLLALREFKRAYKLTKELEKYNKKLHDEFRLHRKLTDLAWIHRDYRYIYDIFWKRERRGELEANYEKLISLEKSFKKRGRLSYLYKRAWEKSNRMVFLYNLLYLYMERKEFDKFRLTIDSLNSRDKKSLEKDINYNILLANYYIEIGNLKKAKKSFLKAIKLDNRNISTHQTYLWFLIDNRLKSALSKEIFFLRENPKLQQEIGVASIIGAMVLKKYELALKWSKSIDNSLSYIDKSLLSLEIGNHTDAYSFAFEGLEKSYKNPNLYRLYSDMINRDYPKGDFASRYRHLSPYISAIENRLNYRWQLYKGLESKLSFTQYRYRRDRDKNMEDNTLALSLKNSNKKLLWDLTIAKHNALNEFISLSLGLKYKLSDMTLGIKSNYQTKTKQTPKLQTQATENSIELKLNRHLTQRVQLALIHKESRYKKEDKNKLGNSSHTQLNANYLLRAGYPDIRFNSYLTLNQYENISNYTLLPKDFLEFGTQLSIGTSTQNRLKRGWRPFGTLGLSINNREEIGTNLSLGISGAFRGEDSLSLLFDYSKGVDALSSASYGVHLEYRF